MNRGLKKFATDFTDYTDVVKHEFRFNIQMMFINPCRIRNP